MRGGAFMPNRSSRGFSRSIQNKQRLMYAMAIRVQGTGTAAVLAGGSDVTLVDNGTGDYTITFRQAFKRVPSIVVSSLTANSIALVSAPAVGSFKVLGFQATDGTTAADIDFHVIVMGSDASDVV